MKKQQIVEILIEYGVFSEFIHEGDEWREQLAEEILQLARSSAEYRRLPDLYREIDALHKELWKYRREESQWQPGVLEEECDYGCKPARKHTHGSGSEPAQQEG